MVINKLNRSQFQDPRSSIKKKLAYFKEAYTTLEEDLKDLSIPNQCVLLQDVSILAKRALKFDIALELYKRSIKLAPENPIIYYNLGKLLYLNKQYLGSIKSYFTAIKMGFDYNNHLVIFQHIGHSFIDSGKTKLFLDSKYAEQYRRILSGNLNASSMNYKKEQRYSEFGILMCEARFNKAMIFFPDEIILETDTKNRERLEKEGRPYIWLENLPENRAIIETVKKENWIVTENNFNFERENRK